jgi:4'-phosphopantetheinyl transferase
VSLSLAWPASEVRETIAPKEVHVWAWALDPLRVDLAAHTELLDQAELRRMDAFHFARDRARYALAHGSLRRLLGAYLNRPAREVLFRTNQFGKPELMDGDRLCFSLSHSQSIAALAVTREGPVGMDVEDVRPIENEVAAAYFSAAELSDLSGLQGDAWLLAFYRCWTRKEAVLKAEGVGLHRALNGFDVSLLPDAPAELLRSRVHFSYPWKLYDTSPASGTIGALATSHDDAKVACFSFPG